MFDYTFAHWSTFFIAAVLLNLTPGLILPMSSLIL
jgi:hypothetical protein